MELKVINDKGEKQASVPASETLFGRDYNEALIHQVVIAYQANARVGSRKQKTRSEVRHSTKKPWRQKGTGRARVGEIRNPLWRKGGTVFGPQPRSYEYQLPKKVEKGALRAALSAKLQGGDVIVVDALGAGEIKTKPVAALLKTLGVNGKALVVDVQLDSNFALSVRNIAGVRMLPSNRITARDVADTRKVLLTQAALQKLQDVLS
jgi:large subunit ribosomal protein L4